ncbi:hypothetical protein ABZ612_11155 [Streptomyces avermitilis]|uniref:hypothetical protein n=1 Tax=Streptomyces avermitilis TaxID=33903 RepID=UPI00340E09D6
MGGRRRTILAIGGHTGDMALTTGPLPTEHILNAHRGALLALKPGECGRTRRYGAIDDQSSVAAGIMTLV